MTSSVIMSIGEMPAQKANCVSICQCCCRELEVYESLECIRLYVKFGVMGRRIC